MNCIQLSERWLTAFKDAFGSLPLIVAKSVFFGKYSRSEPFANFQADNDRTFVLGTQEA